MSDLKTIDIKGKQYVTVNERLKFFRNNYQNYSLVTEIVRYNDADVRTVEIKNEAGLWEKKNVTQPREVVFKASILNEKGVIMATGFAHEKDNSSFINNTSFLENAETSAWGRCLANFGIGIDANVCSADELINAIKNELR